MSLLMKALEKAAKDRGETATEPAAAASAEPKPELSLALEPLSADTPSPGMKQEAPPTARMAQRASTGTPSHEQTRAATVMQAGADVAGDAGTYVRAHPLFVFGVLAALFAIGFGTYVYLQIFHPGFFIRQTPAAKTPPALAQAPAPSAPVPVVPPALPADPLLRSPVPEPLEPPAPAIAPAPQPKPPVVSAPQKTEPDAPRNTIVVSRGSAMPAVNPLLTDAYAALQAGRLEAAQRFYTQLARTEPKNVDVLLGLAAIALQEGRTEDATRHYLAILDLDPRNALAQSGLIGLLGRADPLAAETRLKQLIAREPSAFLYFTLGNLYADHSLWAQAQQAFFQAHHLEPTNPDYAYNLAVGLEHLGQHKFALDFYRRALELASARGHANFDRALTEERTARLASQLN